jgi:L-2,4-diaminobutyrate decarboxylase
MKPFIAMQHIGLEIFEKMIDCTIQLAEEVSDSIDKDPLLELAYKTPIYAVVFRFLSDSKIDGNTLNTINNSIKTNLLLSGHAIIGQTYIDGDAFLKFTFLNPMTQKEDVLLLLEEIKSMGQTLVNQQQKLE